MSEWKKYPTQKPDIGRRIIIANDHSAQIISCISIMEGSLDLFRNPHPYWMYLNLPKSEK